MNHQNPTELSPKINRKTALAIIENRAKAMLNANRSDYLREQLIQKQNERCPICKELLDTSHRSKTNVHHLKYDWICPYTEDETTDRCEKCHNEHPDEFNICISGNRFIVVHCRCHYKIHEQDIKENNKTKSDETIAKNNFIDTLYPKLKELAEQSISVEHFIQLCNKNGISARIRQRTGNICFRAIDTTTKKRRGVSSQHKKLREFQVDILNEYIQNN